MTEKMERKRERERRGEKRESGRSLPCVGEWVKWLGEEEEGREKEKKMKMKKEGKENEMVKSGERMGVLWP